ncbi:NAD(P)/FAD-dependent oxidoreductase [Pseudonocardia sp. C8]|uniref:NAD(P)/FAD-dependent oxidoreductase n=1 Tax=Pseudonocardia sp. C8 TaxID=2762759 RepID=UPI00164275E7|nr:NAD(P)/FAD-dependent oxidoreductase [Pseudonocardia sp. C8]MBC3193368.1 NAD(P)/FAD-dependent oxidoreductase [Pseudonocardia sp. C8]
MDTDVVIAGAGIAGCTAAILYGRAGLRVVLVEKHRSATTAKTLCGHYILAGTEPTLRRLGLWDRMLAEGARAGVPAVHGAAGWMVPTGADLPAAISLRRSRLDPMLRAAAATTPGVRVMLGTTVTGLLDDGGHVHGLEVREHDGARHRVGARLVVGADGHRSAVARLAGAREDVADNQRFLYWAYYRGVVPRGPGSAQIWRLDDHVVVATPTDDGLTLLGAFPTKEHLAAFRADRVAALESFLARVPDGPDLSGAERVSPVIGTADYPIIRRDPVPRPGLALVGDAAMVGDPVPAVGCGWAFRSAEWLADATTGPLADLRAGTGGERGLARALRRYRRAHRFAERHDRLDRDDARALPPNAVQRAIRTAAVHDPWVARRVYRFAMRAAPVTGLLNPVVVARSAWVARSAPAVR